MAIDTASDNLNPFSGFFWGNDPNVNSQLRQRLALQMISQGKGKGYPKNIGEGLSAIGDSLGEIGMAKRLEQADLAQQRSARARGELAPQATPAPGYAPPDQVAPAVSAINSALSGGGATPDAAPDMLTAPPPAQPTSMLSPTMPSDLGGEAPAPTPQQAGSLMSPQPTMGLPPAQGAAEGGYNMLDAQADMGRTPGPGYVQDAIQGATTNPDMQAYLSQLVKKEAPNGPADRSPTGADGPYQFTRGTGRQYGLMGAGGDQRRDLGASTDAALKLTQDNAAIFAKINGRPPTMAELALMHQQGGGTGSRMVAGTGNAPPGNLAVNNINPQSSPAQAVAGIKRYYGMPDRAVDPRAGIASALMARSGVPQPNPMQAGEPSSPVSPDGGQPTRLAFNGAPSNVQSDISRAPPFAPQIRQAPPQLAQAAPDPGYVTTPPRVPTQPPQIPPSQKEMQLIFDAQSNPYLAPLAAQETAKRVYQQNQLEEAYKLQVKQYEELTKMGEEQKTTQAKRRQEYGITADKAPLELKKMQQELDKGQQGIITPTSLPPGTYDPRLGSPQSPQRSGVPAVPPVPVGIAPEKWNELQAPQMTKAVAAYEQAMPQFNDAMTLLKQAREHPGREAGIGAGSKLMSNMPGTEAFGFNTLMKQIAGQNFLKAYATLKGGGSITEIEGQKAQEAQARLNTAQSKGDFDKAMADFETQLRQDMETVQRKVNKPVTAYRLGGDNSSYAPDIGQRTPGGTKEYIGGNPRLESSWRSVQ